MNRTRTFEIDNYLELTFSEDEKQRLEGIRGLCPCHVKHNEPRVWDRVLEMIDDPSVKVRSSVLHTLGDGSPNERLAQVVEAIEKLHNDPDLKLRRHARKLLAHYRRTGIVNIL